MPIPTEPVKRVCSHITVWESGVNIPNLEVSINNYLEEITAYLKDNSLLISAPKSSVTLLTPDTHQAKIHPRILIENSHLPLVKCPRILGVYLDPSLSFNKHSQYVAERVSGRNNILKALACTSWGQQKETLLMTYKAVGRSIINYAAPVWSPNLHDTNYRKIKYTQNEALRIATGCHKMSSIDHLHTEAEMLKVRIHSDGGSMGVPKISAYSWCNCQATHNRLQIEINYYPDSLLFVSAGFLPRVSSQRLN